MASTLISLERSLQADGWWYSSATRQWSRMWDDEMQYGQIQEGHFIRVYPDVKKEPKQSLKETLLNQGWTYRLMEDEFYRTELGKQVTGRIIGGEFVRDAMADVGHIDGFSFHSSPLIPEATMADVGEEKLPPLIGVIDDKVWTDEEERDVALHGRSYQARLRDSFARDALNGFLSNATGWSPKELALRCYEYADAMMIAREMKRG